jgi:hypothetical protein
MITFGDKKNQNGGISLMLMVENGQEEDLLTQYAIDGTA